MSSTSNLTSKKILVVLGPTATGKTSLALNLAKKFNGELISIDSRQIYRGLDIGTGKDIGNLRPRVSNLETSYGKLRYYLFDQTKLWLTDLITPDQIFSVAHFLPLAHLLINDIQTRGKRPIFVGGTGFYLKALLQGLDTGTIKPNPFLRSVLTALPTPALSFLIRIINPSKWKSMTFSDQKNSRRLIRALEISLSRKNTLPVPLRLNHDFCLIGLKTNLKTLRPLIQKRVQKRLDQGLLSEIEKLIEKYSWSDPGLNTLSYKEFKPYFQGVSDLKTCIKNWEHHEYQYAKRQITWFKKQKNITYLLQKNATINLRCLKRR